MAGFADLLQGPAASPGPVQRLLQQFAPNAGTFQPNPLSSLSLAQRAQDLAVPKLAKLDSLLQQAIQPSAATPDDFSTRFTDWTPNSTFVQPPAAIGNNWSFFGDLSHGPNKQANPWADALGLMGAAAQRKAAAAQNGTSTSGTGGPALDPSQTGILQYKDMLMKASQESGVPWELLAAFMQQESNGQNLAPNNDGAEGVMQIVPSYWQGTADKYGGDLMDPWTNIRTAADIIAQNYKQYGNWDDAIHAYYGWGVDPNGPSGADYVSQVKANWDTWNAQSGQPASPPQNGAAAGAIQTATSFIGTPYMLGGMGPDQGGFDCSGLTQYAYAKQGVYIPRTAQEQFDSTTRVGYDQAQAGDLIFFHDTNPDSPNYVTHVGIYLGNGKMLQAGSNGVTVSDISDQYWQDHFVSFGRVNGS